MLSKGTLKMGGGGELTAQPKAPREGDAQVSSRHEEEDFSPQTLKGLTFSHFPAAFLFALLPPLPLDLSLFEIYWRSLEIDSWKFVFVHLPSLPK